MSSLYEQFTNMCRLYPNNKALIYYHSMQDHQVLSYTEINKLSRTIWEWLEDYIENTTCIGIFLKDQLLLVPVILGIHKGKCSFISLIGNESSEAIKHITTAAKIKYFLSTKSNIFPNIITVSTLCIENNDLILWTLPYIKSDLIQYKNNIAYIIKTSGSTGAPKLVFATHACINPNIEQLRNDFGITPDDVIYMGTPATFDPFIVELYLAFTNGSCAIMVSKNLKYSDEILQILFEITPITFLQTTPSLFRLWHVNLIKQYILSKCSALRILAFGGEVCPSLLELKQWKEKENKTRIFYLYGITEVSCWAMVREIKMNDMVEDIDGIYLGKPMIETTIEIRDENIKDIQPAIGELFIGSKTRKCIMEGEDTEMLSNNDYIFRATGDLVKWHDRKIYYVCRMNDCIKRYGTKVNLYNIEKKINSLKNVENCCCIWIAELGQLILFYKTCKRISKDVFWHLIKSHLEEIEFPDFVHLIEDFPLSDHGKISKIKLKQLFEETIYKSDHITSRQYFFQELENLIPNIKKDISFLHAGGSSTTALITVNKLEATTGLIFKKLVAMLLNDNISIDECAKYVDEISKLQNQNHIDEVAPKPFSHSSTFNIAIQWTYNLDKCVDATPTLLENTYVCVGSHSHKLATLDAHTGYITSSMKLGDRIESSVTFLSHDSAVVGCYDGLLYCFNPQSGKVNWTFKTGDMIKSRACYIKEKSVLFITSYDRYLYSINSIDGVLNWSIKICHKPILATPCISKNSIFCCSLGGTVACINISGALKWSKKYKYPIFSSPMIIQEGSGTTLCLFSEVDGTLHCINENGLEVWQYTASGSVYSSFICYEKDFDTHLVIFGCHDKSIYCLEIRNDIHTSEPSLKWKCLLKSPIYATPNIIILQEKVFVIAASTIGQICIINFETGNISHDMKINGEIYSSPVVFEDRFYLGSRDNNLYCFKVSLNIS